MRGPMLGRPLFIYGTLRDADLLCAVLGRAVDARNLAPAVAPGFRAVCYPGRNYPALVPHPGGAAAGEIVVALSRLERAILDAFEGEEYRRGIVPVLIEGELHEADGYLPMAPIGVGAEPWSLEVWQQRHKPAALPADAAAAAAIRRRLGFASAR